MEQIRPNNVASTTNARNLALSIKGSLYEQDLRLPHIKMVEQFNEIGGQSKEFIDENILLRAKLIAEELSELLLAMSNMEVMLDAANDITELIQHNIRTQPEFERTEEERKIEYLDAVADLEYVVLGSYRLAANIDEALDIFYEVHSSNMTKFPPLTKHPVECYGTVTGLSITTNNEQGVMIARNVHGKIIKPKTYTPANIKWVKENSNF